MAQREHSDSRSGPLPLHANAITIACHCIAAGTFIRFNSPYALSYFGGNLIVVSDVKALLDAYFLQF